MPSLTFAQSTTTNSCIQLAHDMGRYSTDARTDGEVSVLQQLLKDKGYFPQDQEVTGIMGPITRQAIRDFQSANGLPVTAYVGALTRGTIQLQTCGSLNGQTVAGAVSSAGCIGNPSFTAAEIVRSILNGAVSLCEIATKTSNGTPTPPPATCNTTTSSSSCPAKNASGIPYDYSLPPLPFSSWTGQQLYHYFASLPKDPYTTQQAKDAGYDDCAKYNMYTTIPAGPLGSAQRAENAAFRTLVTQNYFNGNFYGFGSNWINGNSYTGNCDQDSFDWNTGITYFHDNNYAAVSAYPTKGIPPPTGCLSVGSSSCSSGSSSSSSGSSSGSGGGSSSTTLACPIFYQNGTGNNCLVGGNADQIKLVCCPNGTISACTATPGGVSITGTNCAYAGLPKGTLGVATNMGQTWLPAAYLNTGSLNQSAPPAGSTCTADFTTYVNPVLNPSTGGAQLFATNPPVPASCLVTSGACFQADKVVAKCNF